MPMECTVGMIRVISAYCQVKMFSAMESSLRACLQLRLLLSTGCSPFPLAGKTRLYSDQVFHKIPYIFVTETFGFAIHTEMGYC